MVVFSHISNPLQRKLEKIALHFMFPINASWVVETKVGNSSTGSPYISTYPGYSSEDKNFDLPPSSSLKEIIDFSLVILDLYKGFNPQSRLNNIPKVIATLVESSTTPSAPYEGYTTNMMGDFWIQIIFPMKLKMMVDKEFILMRASGEPNHLYGCLIASIEPLSTTDFEEWESRNDSLVMVNSGLIQSSSELQFIPIIPSWKARHIREIC
ncbi:hypothetical protein SADUNF_Sadunf18G0049900 [Salix dunnii]|uniref:Uncharacterized protein n=1 Tax=Salix dunnii TaxID=1413687 RepID=A0A835MDN1_9ROSI|nr:hypothetical protein SADUNF_Sadunf18G0049900 [Salix dunnii]